MKITLRAGWAVSADGEYCVRGWCDDDGNDPEMVRDVWKSIFAPIQSGLVTFTVDVPDEILTITETEVTMTEEDSGN